MSGRADDEDSWRRARDAHAVAREFRAFAQHANLGGTWGGRSWNLEIYLRRTHGEQRRTDSVHQHLHTAERF